MLGLAAACVPGGRPAAALAEAWRGKAGSGGWPEAAMVAALGLDLAAVTVGPAELERARMLYTVACLINAGAVAALALLLLSV
jgi:hypothetical protein